MFRAQHRGPPNMKGNSRFCLLLQTGILTSIISHSLSSRAKASSSIMQIRVKRRSWQRNRGCRPRNGCQVGNGITKHLQICSALSSKGMPPRPREHTEMATQWKVGVTVAASLSPSSYRLQIEDDLGTTRSTPYVGSVCGASDRAAVVLGHGQRQWWCWG
jgi:hypothetical protein